MTQLLYRRILDFERNFISIKWVKEPTPTSVVVVGSFTNPPWEKKVELDYCPLRRMFVKYINNIGEGLYLMKFLVDGVFMCSPDLPVATDSNGFLNNILEIV